MGGFAPGLREVYRFKIIVLAAYLVSALFFLVNKQARKQSNASVLIGLWLTYFLTFMFYENTKEVKYAIHIVCLYDVILALFVLHLLSKTWRYKAIGTALATVFISISVGGLLYTVIVQDELHRGYLPAAAYLKEHAEPGDLILAGTELGFALGFDQNIVDDNNFTYYTRKQPKYILIDNGARTALANGSGHIEILPYFETLISEKYHEVYSKGQYSIFERNS